MPPLSKVGVGWGGGGGGLHSPPDPLFRHHCIYQAIFCIKHGGIGGGGEGEHSVVVIMRGQDIPASPIKGGIVRITRDRFASYSIILRKIMKLSKEVLW